MTHAESPGVRHAAIVKRYQDTDKKIYMTMDEAIALSLELADRLRSWDPQPEAVVGIANGALMMTKLISDRLNLPVCFLTIRRRGSALKQRLFRIPGARRVASFLYAVPHARPPLRYVNQNLMSLQDSAGHSEDLLVTGKVVALIDDCILSGQSIARASEIIHAAQAKSVVVGCISWSRSNDSATENGVAPHTYITRRTHHYPWSMNSPYWRDYVSWLADNGISQVK